MQKVTAYAIADDGHCVRRLQKSRSNRVRDSLGKLPKAKRKSPRSSQHAAVLLVEPETADSAGGDYPRGPSLRCT